MHLEPRYETYDFRDTERRQPAGTSVWSSVGKALSLIGKTAFVGWTAYNLFVIGGWLSDWYAKRRAEKVIAFGRYPRVHPRRWDLEV
jgi:hypothetical protein